MKQYAARFNQPASFCSAQLDVRGGRYVLYAAALIASPVYLAFVREGSAGHGDGATDASRQPRTPNGAAAIPESIWRYRRSDGAVIAIQIVATRLATPPVITDIGALHQFATSPASSSPSCGPPMETSALIPTMRPRK